LPRLTGDGLKGLAIAVNFNQELFVQLMPKYLVGHVGHLIGIAVKISILIYLFRIYLFRIYLLRCYKVAGTASRDIFRRGHRPTPHIN
jgi:hypothetical protein